MGRAAQAAQDPAKPVVAPSSSDIDQQNFKEETKDDDKGGKKGKKNGKSDRGDEPAGAIEVKGRAFVLARHSDDRIDAGQTTVDSRTFTLSLPAARAGMKVRIREGLTFVLEADFAGRTSIRDGYLQWKGKRWLVRAGRFKMPLSAFTLESPWVLPKAQRGLLDDILSEHMFLFGRREGVMVRYDAGGWWDPAVSVGAFQSLLWGTLAGDAVAQGSPAETTAVVRVSVKPWDTEFALVGQSRATLIGTANRKFASGGADVTSEVAFGDTPYALRVWAEAFAGQSWYQFAGALNDPMAQATAPAVTYLEGRLLAAFRRGGAERGEPYGEVFFSGGLLDPDALVTQDQWLEVSGGVNVGHWQTTRLTLEIEHSRTGRNFPRSIFQTFERLTVMQHTAVLLQVGAAF